MNKQLQYSKVTGEIMEFFELVSKRRSIRLFEKREIEKEKIQKILECANQAPSAGNLQGYEIFVVTQKTQLAQLVGASQGQGFLEQVSVVLVFCANPSRSGQRYKERGEKLYCIQDATIACTYAMLAATALGLSTVWVGAFVENEVIKVLGIPATLRPIALLPIGYAEIPQRASSRRPLDDLIHFVGDEFVLGSGNNHNDNSVNI
jgi:nitroreductase